MTAPTSLQIKLSLMELYRLTCTVERKFFNRFMFFINALFYSEQFNKLHNFFANFINISVIAHNTRIYRKLFDAYLFCGLTVNEKMLYITGHYQYLQNNYSVEFISSIYLLENGSILLGKIQLDNCNDLSIKLVKPSTGFLKEGELNLMLIDDETNISIFSSTFIFNDENNITRIIIGRIQGTPSRYADGEEMIRNLTKNMHGLRPSALLIYIFQCICKQMEIDELWAVTTEKHISKCTRVQRRDRFKMDYNQYWIEFGGVKTNESYYTLPTNFKPKDMAAIKSNKRAMYSRRFNMMIKLEAEVMNTLKLWVLPT